MFVTQGFLYFLQCSSIDNFWMERPITMCHKFGVQPYTGK